MGRNAKVGEALSRGLVRIRTCKQIARERVVKAGVVKGTHGDSPILRSIMPEGKPLEPHRSQAVPAICVQRTARLPLGHTFARPEATCALRPRGVNLGFG